MSPTMLRQMAPIRSLNVRDAMREIRQDRQWSDHDGRLCRKAVANVAEEGGCREPRLAGMHMLMWPGFSWAISTVDEVDSQQKRPTAGMVDWLLPVGW